MNALVVDTSVWISYFRVKAFSGEEELELALKEGRVYVPPIVVAELMSGSSPPRQREQLSIFVKQLDWCQCDIEHWERVGILRGTLARMGLSVSTPDAHVAQCALDLNCFLMSEDAVFTKMAQKCPLRLLRE